MTSGGVEALKAAFRRSLPLIIGLLVLGVVAVNLFKQAEGAKYEATAKVLVSSNPLGSIISGTQPSFVDPDRLQQTALGIAESAAVYEIAANRSNMEFGDAGELQSATTVSADANSDLIAFTSSSSDSDESIGMANAVAEGYIDFRTRLAAQQVRQAISGLEASLETLPDDSSRRPDIEEQIDTLKALEENATDTQLVEAASAADKTSPAPLEDSLVGLSIGLIIALVVVAIREAIDTTVRSEGDVEDLLSVPVLAGVRSIPRRSRLVTYGRHEATYADAYALLAAQLDQTRAGEKGSVLAVTSAVPREGKTATAANLAVAAARRGSNVIIADFDFRKPGLVETFGLPGSAPGALQVMSYTASLANTYWSVTLEGPSPRPTNTEEGLEGRAPGAPEPVAHGSLRILPAGGSTRTVPQQERLQYLLRMLRSDADLVIVDTPPALLTVEMAELSKLIDAVMVVVRHGRVSRRNLRILQRQLRTWPAEVVGAVMTDMPPDGDYAYYDKG